jgi:hypothetical protein
VCYGGWQNGQRTIFSRWLGFLGFATTVKRRRYRHGRQSNGFLHRQSIIRQKNTDKRNVRTFGGVLGGGKLAFELRLSVSSRVVPDSSGGVDSMRGLMPPSKLKKRWSSEDNCGLEELLLGVRAGREEGGIGDVCATSELLMADEGGNDDELARA